MNKRLLLCAALIISLLFVLSIAGCTPAGPGEDATPPEEEGPAFDGEIKIAVTGPMTNIQGEMMWWGASMAVD